MRSGPKNQIKKEQQLGELYIKGKVQGEARAGRAAKRREFLGLSLESRLVCGETVG